MRVLGIALLCLTTVVEAQSRAAEVLRSVGDSTAVAQVVVRYHEALARDDTATVLRLLAPTAVHVSDREILTMADLRATGIAAHGRWERAIQRDNGTIHVRVSGNTAWAYWLWPMRARANPDLLKGREAELLVLLRNGDTWQIAAIHASVGES
ncbi:MAG: nuclear transport factor 2 family protein [Gemmatimonadota bacterium]